MRIKKGFLMLCMAIAMTIALPTIDTNVINISTVEAASKVKLNKKKITLYVGKTTTLKVKGTKKKVKWSSSKKSVATVSSKGKVKAKKKGTTTITAKVGGKKYKCKVTVKKAVKVSKVTLDKSKMELVVGQTGYLYETIKPNNATDKSISWTSSNSNVAKVSNGVIEAISPGTTVIKVTSGKKSATCMVTVKPIFNIDTQNITIKDTGRIYVTINHPTAIITCSVTDTSIITAGWNQTYRNGYTQAIDVVANKNGVANIILTNNINDEKTVITVTVSGHVEPIEYLGDRSVDYSLSNQEHRLFFSLMTEDKTRVASSGLVNIKIVDNNGVELYNKQVAFTENDFNYWTGGSSEAQYLCCIKIPDTELKKSKVANGNIVFKVILNDGSSFSELTCGIDHLPQYEASELCKVIPPEPTIACYYSVSGDLKTMCDITGTVCNVDYNGLGGFTLDLDITGTKIYDSAGSSSGGTCRFKVKLYKDGVLVDDKYVLIYSLYNDEKFKETVTFLGLEEGVYEMIITDYQ